jgi:hypothetical protein
MTGVFAPPMQATGLHHPDQAGSHPLPAHLSDEGREQFGSCLTHPSGRFGQAAIRIVPGGSDQC